MRHKRYESKRAIKQDQLAGALLFPIVLGALWLIALNLDRLANMEVFSTIFPWVFCGIFVTIGLIYRPHIIVGFFGGIGAWFLIAAGLGLAVAGGCFVAVVISLPFLLLGGVGGVLLFIAWPVLTIWGLVKIGEVGKSMFNEWWKIDE
ncbi:MAG: hypothetical protein AAF485_18100 [Chloroflexota bacterium]